LILLTNLSLAWAQYEDPQNVLELTDEEINPSRQDIGIKKTEKYQRNDSLFQTADSSNGAFSDRIYTGDDRHKVLGAYLLQGNYEQLNQQQGLEFTYMYKNPSWKNTWWGLTFRQTQTKFKFITNTPEATAGSSPTSEALEPRKSNDPQALTQAGFGGGYRFKLLLDFLPTNNVFETIDFFITHNRMNDTEQSKVFTGFGMLVDYSLLKRTGSSFFYGGKFNYNMALVSRDIIDTESKAETRLTLSWFSLGFVMGYFF